MRQSRFEQCADAMYKAGGGRGRTCSLPSHTTKRVPMIQPMDLTDVYNYIAHKRARDATRRAVSFYYSSLSCTCRKQQDFRRHSRNLTKFLLLLYRRMITRRSPICIAVPRPRAWRGITSSSLADRAVTLPDLCLASRLGRAHSHYVARTASLAVSLTTREIFERGP